MAHVLPTNMANSTGVLLNLASWANVVTGGWFWAIGLWGFMVVLFVGAARYSTERAFGWAGMAGLLGAIILAILNLISWQIASANIVIGVLGIVWMILRK